MLAGKGLLTPIQRTFLAAFAEIADQAQFYLTGGTALAEFYLGHRLSFDVDFFTGEQELILPVSYQIEALATQRGFQISVTRRFATFVELLLSQKGESLRVDLALDSPFRFESPVLTENGTWVNSFRDLKADKLLAYYGRAEPRDAVDLYFILRQEPLDNLLAMAAQKDLGFDLYWFAVALNRAEEFPDELERWPIKMLLPFDPIELKQEFQRMALDSMSRIAS